MRSLPTFQDCLWMVENNPDLTFTHKTSVVNGYTYHIFNYMFAYYEHFLSNKEKGAYEMRGITFVENEGEYVRYLMLDKFFNLNQVEETQYHLVKNKSIMDVSLKEDGSMIAFIKLPNGNVVAKTKLEFQSSMAVSANRLYENDENLQNFIAIMHDLNYIPIFEYCSPYNMVVLEHQVEELRLIRIRNNTDGTYVPLSSVDKTGVIVAPTLGVKPLDELIEAAKDTTGIEGWVVTFSDSMMIKIKTDWYMSLHGLITNEASRYDYLISMVIENTIDDLISKVSGNTLIMEMIDNSIYCVKSYIEHIMNEMSRYKDIYENTYNKLNKEFSINHSKEEFYGFFMQYIKNDKETFSTYIKNKILKDTYHLLDAKEFVKRWEKN